MIDIKSLRIGNLILDHTGTIREVAYIGDTIGLKNDSGGTDKYQKDLIISGDIGKLKGVPLIGEILLKIGFKEYPWFEGAYIKYNDSHLMIRWYKDDIIAFTCYVMDGKEEMLHKNVKHIKKGLIVNLHQLQNFYYFNTGQELNTSEL